MENGIRFVADIISVATVMTTKTGNFQSSCDKVRLYIFSLIPTLHEIVREYLRSYNVEC